MKQELTPNERAFSGELAKHVANHCHNLIHARGNVVVRQEALAALPEQGLDLLLQLGVYKMVENTRELRVGPDAVSSFVSSLNCLERSHFEVLLKLYFELFLNGKDQITSTRKPFDVPKQFKTVANYFVQLGYMKPVGRQLVWTDIAARRMESVHKWNDGISIKDEVEDEQRRRVEVIYSEIPSSLKKKFKIILEKQGWEAMTVQIPKHFEDGRWHAKPRNCSNREALFSSEIYLGDIIDVATLLKER